MITGAIGMVEVNGAVNSVIVTDRMLKAAAVSYETRDSKCGGHCLIFISGDVSAVAAAVDTVKNNPPCKIFNTAVIASPSEEMIRIVEGFKLRFNKK